MEMKAAEEPEELNRFIAESKKETAQVISWRWWAAPPRVSLVLLAQSAGSWLKEQDEKDNSVA